MADNPGINSALQSLIAGQNAPKAPRTGALELPFNDIVAALKSGLGLSGDKINALGKGAFGDPSNMVGGFRLPTSLAAPSKQGPAVKTAIDQSVYGGSGPVDPSSGLPATGDSRNRQ